ncbi:YdbL family protein [Pseudodesulfovibrio sp.]|nr:YdbL family protein [Pseudodesulfovibrio sp.]
MRNRKYIFGLVLLIFCLTTATAMADGIKERMIQRKPAIDALLAEGTLGENNIGLLEYRGNDLGLPEVTAENEDRLTVYKAIARKTGTTITVVGQRRAAMIAQQAPPGTWLQDTGGQWYKK